MARRRATSAAIARGVFWVGFGSFIDVPRRGAASAPERISGVERYVAGGTLVQRICW